MLDQVNPDYEQPAVDYHEEFKKLEAKKTNGELEGSDAFKSMCQIAKENGFRCESKRVTTEDGYILNIWRLRSQDLAEGAPAVLL